MKRQDVFQAILADRSRAPGRDGRGSACANIALCKYWGKRDVELNLPVTSSLSVTVPDFGAETVVRPVEGPNRLTLNGETCEADDLRAQRVFDFLTLLPGRGEASFEVLSDSRVPVGAGLASSASGFAALVLALNDLYGWTLDTRELSILARLGSGSACRSMLSGFVEWHAGERTDGMDSFAEAVGAPWPGLCLGVITVTDAPKPIGSREAMRRTVDTSILYRKWPDRAAADLNAIKTAIAQKDMEALGTAAEGNALAMHATMLDSRPPILYALPRTVEILQTVWNLRAEGIAVYATMDAGPNVKLLFEASSSEAVGAAFPDVQTFDLFGGV